MLDLNIMTFTVICESLQIEIPYLKTNSFQQVLPKEEDFRFMANAKSTLDFDLKKYVQVFDEKHGFLPNLSILDLLFNEGPNALHYLEKETKKLVF